MVYLLKSFARSPERPAPPQRRRTIVIGGGPTGISAAFHLGEHSLLLERRTSLEETHDHPHDLPLGAARGGSLGAEEPAADGQKAFFVIGNAAGEPPEDTDKLIHVERWRPPTFLPLVPLLRGELRLGANVVRVSPSKHLLELADGSRFVYEKLLSTVPIVEMVTLVMHELASRISHAEFFRYWLSEHDIEVADRATQVCHGDINELVAGKRVAELINRALAGRFQSQRRGSSFFHPHLVKPAAATP